MIRKNSARGSIRPRKSRLHIEPLERRDLLSFYGTYLSPPIGFNPGGTVVADFNGDTFLDVGTLATSGAVSLINVKLNNGDGTLGAADTYSVGPTSNLAAGDVDSDGDQDLIFIGGGLTFLANNGDGTFVLSPNNYPTGFCDEITVGDLNGDTELDVLVAGGSAFPGTVTVHLGNGDGTFVPMSSYGTGILGTHEIAVADFNGDAKLDVAVNSVDTSVLFGNGDGSLQAPVIYDTQGLDIVAADFNGDADVDLAIVDHTTNDNPGFVRIMYNAGDGTFGAPASYPVDLHSTWVTAADFDNDGDQDIAVGGRTAMTVLRNQLGSFRRRVSYEPPVAGNLVTGDMNNDGAIDIITTVEYFDDVAIYYGHGNGGFKAAVHYTAPSGPVASADVDVDGRPDVIIGHNDRVTIMQGRSGGTFKQAGSYFTGRGTTTTNGGISAVGAGDFNADGVPDVAAAFAQAGLVVVLPNIGSGAFATPAPEYPASDNPYAGAAGDFNADGKQDVAIADFGGQVVILLGNGNGTFQLPQGYAAGTSTAYVAVADLNGDGKQDLAVANYVPDGKVAVLLGNGDGSFQAAVAYVVGIHPIQVVAADFNLDGKQDLATANLFGDSVSVLLGNGNGTFQSAGNYPINKAPRALVVGDFDGDAIPDLATSNSAGANTAAVLLGRGDGTFKPPSYFAVGDDPYDILTADFNLDGKQDLAVVNRDSPAKSTVDILLGNGNGSFSPKVSYATNALSESADLGDFNGDGILDIAVDNRALPGVAVLRGRGEGTFAPPLNYLASSAPNAVVAVDLNADGDTDLVGLTAVNNAASVFMATGAGLAAPVAYQVGSSPAALATHDFDGDGRSDLVVVNAGSVTVSVLMATTGGLFEDAVHYGVGSTPTSVALADYNDDGFTDMAVANFGNDTVTILLGNGDGTFVVVSGYPTVNPYTIAAGDFNNDGNVDLVTASDGTVSVLLGTGGGAFGPPVSYPANALSRNVQVADFNLDGNPDVAVTNSDYAGTISVLLGNGDGTFAAATAYAVGTKAGPLLVVDPNGDGYADLLCAIEPGMSVLFNAADWPPLPIGDGPRPFVPVELGETQAVSRPGSVTGPSTDSVMQPTHQPTILHRLPSAPRRIARLAVGGAADSVLGSLSVVLD